MLDTTKQELDKYNALTPTLNSHIKKIVDAIPFNVNPRMKAVIAISQLTTFASQFRRNLLLWDDASIPVNAIAFVIKGSGAGGDSSVKAARKCFTTGYNLIIEARYKLAVQDAKKRAQSAGDEPSDSFEIYKNYMRPLPPIDIMPTTEPGLIQHINDIGENPITSGVMYCGEVSDELAYNKDMIDNIKVLSEVYDTGDKEIKYTKGVEFRSKEIVAQPVSALFIGSPGHILYDEATKKKFNVAFMSKLARRSWFCFVPEKIIDPVFDNVDQMIEYEEQLEDTAKKARLALDGYIREITTFGLSTATNDIAVPREIHRLFKTYKRYNSDFADTFVNQESTSALIRRHLQWKALKLAGAFAIFEKQNTVTIANYVDAIRLCELLANDMELFEYHLNKSDHERFSDFIQTQVLVDNKATISLHELKKQNFIQSTTKAKLQELVTLCCAYDTNGLYSVINEGSAIQYEPIVKTEILGISFKPLPDTAELTAAVASKDKQRIDDAKHNIAKQVIHDFDYNQTTFPDLANLLSQNFAYSPFQFANGTRGKDNIVSGTKWLVYDIDKSTISASEAHFMLSDTNHHIALSSDETNEYKFRLLIELDSNVDLDPITWKHFYAEVAEYLALRVDPLPQSQVFFAYEGRQVTSVLNAEPLSVRQFIINAKDKVANSSTARPLSTSQQKALLNDPLETFAFAFNAPYGAGSRSVIRAIYYLRDLGGTLEDALALFNDIQEYWESPFPPARANAMVDQIKRLF